MRKIILASTSIRRKELMTFLGIPYEVVASDFPEEDVDPRDFEDPREYVATLAAGKAIMVAQSQEDAIVIGVDTTVFVDGKYYGKPASLDEARKTLASLRGRKHQVFTAICMIDTLTQERQMEVVETGVTFLQFSDESLERYIQTSESMGKAGAYAIQAGAKGFVQSVEGSMSSVVGLPLTELAQMLERFDVRIDVDVRRIEEEQFTHEPSEE
jgi:septum formation protein